ncbi:MAG: U32 family peptidase [Eubacterium sp.]|nr:U32 family peptidase [Eubacterium sp.]
MNKRTELLAPAGNYEAFLGAVNAGADAVYLGGERFGARAYADNFSEKEICRAIHIAHFMGRKIYLTVNTLIKEDEFADLYSYLLPLYEAGLDGVIVQDIGVLAYIREQFKELSLHASTQMTLTGSGGASFLKEHGVERIVPARELSLEEVRRIKEETGLEIECFIHGAMCYCYSGQCLFSSMLGGRSGNRGRCAQPCRLPYQVYEESEKMNGVDYPLSLKDMCTIDYIPKLIDAGIDSFKIEGRMKKPEYAAGVTAIYRKYIDLYEEKGIEAYHVDKADMQGLQNLYIRSEIQTGYYERHNGREMITLHKPSYVGSDKHLLEEIRAVYLREPEKHPVKMKIGLKAGEPACLRITGQVPLPSKSESKVNAGNANHNGTEIEITVQGGMVEKAQKMPLQSENIRKQMLKTGNSCVTVSVCDIEMEDNVFMPVSALNELRRKGIETYEQQCMMRQGLSARRKPVEEIEIERLSGDKKRFSGFVDDICISTYEQLAVAAGHMCRRIYIDSDLYLKAHEQVIACMEEYGRIEYFLALPYVLRAKDAVYLQKLKEAVTADASVKGFLVRNYEGLSYANAFGDRYEIVPDAGLYSFNEESIRFWSKYSKEYTLPYELNCKEAGRLVRFADRIGMRTVMIVYSRIPMMITANCIRKTAARCAAGSDLPRSGQTKTKKRQEHDKYTQMHLKDRCQTDFPVEINCDHCYNVIYNSVPYSLHLHAGEVHKTGVDIRRYDFTMESAGECRQILTDGKFPYEAYTTGHLKRGVE